jgi:hypothetical protein
MSSSAHGATEKCSVHFEFVHIIDTGTKITMRKASPIAHRQRALIMAGNGQLERPAFASGGQSGNAKPEIVLGVKKIKGLDYLLSP